MRRVRLAMAVLSLAALTACSEQPGFLGRWTIDRVESAPWMAAGTQPDQQIAADYVGKSVAFEDKRIDGPALLACANPKYSFIEVPAEGLFQGGLATSDVDIPKARETATAMGFTTQPVKTMTTGCEHDIAFHMRDDHDAAFALDNMIFWMKRAH